MARLITIEAPETLPPRLEVHPGDLLVVEACGAQQWEGEAVATLLGVFTRGVVGLHQQVLTPAGPPNAVAILAVAPGVARLELVTGDPWRSVRRVPFELIVARASAGDPPGERPPEARDGAGTAG
ncbi:MAG: hypothetical protein FJ083_12605 [Cyanobacteria bacterium K_Offshore_surface_m2_239]|nr:hypothetical protein [Cyanobacteria bacterium K_Offshore_surface_m2_239]